MAKKNQSLKPPTFPVTHTRPVFLTPGFLILAIVAILCASALLGPITTLAQSVSLNNRLKAELEMTEEEYQNALTELEKWNDKQYVISEARENLGYVQKGETKISLIGDTDDLDTSPYTKNSLTDQPNDPERLSDQLKQTWYQRLLRSFE
jgi:cell division protein FtsB